MNAEQVALVQQSFAQVRPIAAKVSSLFYDRLFELDPAVRRLFKADLEEQKSKFMQTLEVVVTSLSQPESIVPSLRDMGRRHADYGVEVKHYTTVGVALLWALEQCLGDAFTREIKVAWIDAYQLISGVMREGARRAS